MIGKVDPAVLRRLVLGRTGAPDDRVVQGPAYGEDTAGISLGEGVLVVNTDPLSLAVERLGTLAVDVACNDVAASGGSPAWLTNVVLLPDGDEETLDEVTRQVDREASRLGVSVVGGHSEYAPALERPMLVVTCLGLGDRYVPTGGARPGDAVIMTKAAAIEGTAILATDFRDRLAGAVPDEVVERATAFYDEIGVLDEAAAVTEYATALHDPTEGGLVDGLFEVAAAAGVALDVDRDAVPVRDETRAICEAAGVDPFRVFGSGALVATVPPEDADDAVATIEAAGVATTVVGTVRESDDPVLRLGDDTYREPVRDEMYDLWA